MLLLLALGAPDEAGGSALARPNPRVLMRLTAADTSTALLADLSGPNITFTRVGNTNSAGHQHGYLSDGIAGRRYWTIEQLCSDASSGCALGDVNTRHAPLESLIRTNDPNCYGGGGSCLQFAGFAGFCTANVFGCITQPTDLRAVSANDREEVVLNGPTAYGDRRTLTYGASRWESFRVKFPNVDGFPSLPSSQVVINQVWQASTGPALKPAFLINLANVDSSTVRLTFGYHNDIKVNAGLLAGVNLSKNAWHRVEVALTPSVPGMSKGQILIWIDRTAPTLDPTTAVNYSAVKPGLWQLNWGYTPATPGPQSDFRISVGMYRTNPLFPVSFWMDDVKVGPTAASIQ